MQKLEDSKGRLTAYALACGYVQRQELGQQIIYLGRHGGGLYYVQATEHYALGGKQNHTFTRLEDARKEFNKAVRYARAVD